MSRDDKSRLNCAVAAEPRLECRFPVCNCPPKVSPLPSTLPPEAVVFQAETDRTVAGLRAMGEAVVNTIRQGQSAVSSTAAPGTLDMSPEARLKDAEADVLRLHSEKMKFFERTIELEREVERYRKGMENWKATAEEKDRLFVEQRSAISESKWKVAYERANAEVFRLAALLNKADPNWGKPMHLNASVDGTTKP